MYMYKFHILIVPDEMLLPNLPFLNQSVRYIIVLRGSVRLVIFCGGVVSLSVSSQGWLAVAACSGRGG